MTGVKLGVACFIWLKVVQFFTKISVLRNPLLSFERISMNSKPSMTTRMIYETSYFSLTFYYWRTWYNGPFLSELNKSVRMDEFLISADVVWVRLRIIGCQYKKTEMHLRIWEYHVSPPPQVKSVSEILKICKARSSLRIIPMKKYISIQSFTSLPNWDFRELFMFFNFARYFYIRLSISMDIQTIDVFLINYSWFYFACGEMSRV